MLFNTTVFIIIIGNETSLVGGDGSLTESWQLDGSEAELIAWTGGVLDSVMVFSSCVSEWVVMRGPVLIEVDGIRIGLSILNVLHLGSTIWHLVWLQQQFCH